MAVLDTSRTTFGATGFFGRIGALLTYAGSSLSAWNDTRATRKALNSLTDRELDDIGLSRAEIVHVIH